MKAVIMVLKLLIAFRESALPPLKVKEYADSFFKNLKDCIEDKYEFDISITDAKNIDFEGVYKFGLSEIEVNLKYFFLTQPYSALFSKVIQVWSDPDQNNKLSNLWLKIANPTVLENSGKICHSDVEIKEIAFGTLPDMQHFMQHYHYVSSCVDNKKEISCSFLHLQCKLVIFACFTHSEICDNYKSPVHNKFQLDYQSISQVIVNYVPGTDLVEIFFNLRHTPFIYLRKSNMKNNESFENIFLASDQEYQAQTWERTLDFGCSCKKFLCTIKRIGRCPVFKVVIPKKIKIYDIIERLIQRCSLDASFYFSNVETITSLKKFQKDLSDFYAFPFNDDAFRLFRSKPVINDIKFKCQYAWELLNCRSYEVKDQIVLKYEKDSKKGGDIKNVDHWKDIKNMLRSFFDIEKRTKWQKVYKEVNHVSDALAKCFYDISEMVIKNVPFDFKDAVKELFTYHLLAEDDEVIPEGMCLVRRIILMPSKILFLPPTEHFDNRVIRNFEVDHFLRVSIQDDNFQKLTFAVLYFTQNAKFIKTVIKEKLLKGIFISPRHYELLAASNSQLRGHGLWMYSKDKKGETAETIRKWMGNFDHIQNVAKYMARMGQCFSTSDEAVQIELANDEVEEIPEVVKIGPEGQKYKFSDGVGKISRDLAVEVRKAFSKRYASSSAGDSILYEPSAFQIRFGGCKGILAEADPNEFPGRKIAIRPSMKKFDCPSSRMLEIIKISAPRAVFLNRPLITILENLKIESGVFLELQKKMVFKLTDSLIYEKKALKVLENYTSLPFPFKKLNMKGISFTQEPFFRSLLFCMYKSMIGNLKRKARIAIPPKYGRNMLGVMDETNTLEYGQIFAQYSEQVGNIFSPFKPLKGDVVVTKNPCMHPGDVRKFKAVDVPALHHIKDCIVFPAKGKRPHPDEMAGSDLDGDEYILLWNEKLIFPGENQEAMDYPANEEDKLKRPIEVKDMVNFIARYIQHDNIGQMANAHLAWADSNEEGIYSDVCKKIAIKYPRALDFAKSGTTESLESSERPKYYPDFMEKGCQNNSYKSEKSLGLLYRVIRNLEASVSNINDKVTVIQNPNFEFHGWSVFKDIATKRRDEYTKTIKSILLKYGLQSEAEALTGFVCEMSECNKNRYDRENTVLLLKNYVSDTMKKYMKKFINDCKDVSSKHPEILNRDIKYLMASAWYMVTYSNSESTVLSFPWVVSEYLSEIPNKNTIGGRKGKVSESMFIECSDLILDYFTEGVYDEEENMSCKCVSLLKRTMFDWMKNASFILTVSSKDEFCMECFKRTVKKFREAKRMCCTYREHGCECSDACSPTKFILQCYKFYASEVIKDMKSCGNKLDTGEICKGLRDLNLQSLALKTYAIIAISQNLQDLGGIENGTDNDDLDSYEEGDPIRIQITKEFEDILTGRVDKVCKILEDLSGVKKVHIGGNTDKNVLYIMVNSTGKAFNRWKLEELIMDPECPSMIESRLH